MTNTFSLYDLIVKNEINGLIFDRFGQKHHLRLFPYKQKLFGSFEAFIYRTIDIRYSSKHLKNLTLSRDDKKVILHAFLHRENLGSPDGMGDLSDPNFNVSRFSQGTKEDNYLFTNEILLKIYNDLDNMKSDFIPLPPKLKKILEVSMSRCYFDKSPIKGNGSICFQCARELRNEGYIIDDGYIATSK